jgi:catalase
MIGAGVLRECLAADDVQEVISIVRTAGTFRHPKLHEIVHADFLDFGPIVPIAFSGIDAAFFCLGISSGGMSEADYTRITYDITLAAARALLQGSPDATFVYVSGAGADSTERSRTMWARVRGRTENALLQLSQKTFIFRPAVVRPVHGVTSRTESYRRFYAVAQPLLPLLHRLFPQWVTSTEAVGRAMLEIAGHGAPRRLLESREINRPGSHEAEVAAHRRAKGSSAGLSTMTLASIGLIAGAAALAFAYTAGWLSPRRLTPARMVDALSHRGGDPVGHRRNHSKGICFIGEFESNGAGVTLSTAAMLAAGHYPVIGRFAIATGDPKAPDVTGRVRSMALRIVAPGREEWRTGMNDSPVFVVSTPRAFYELTRAQEIDPATGKPDPRALQRFFAAHPESAAFAEWARIAPWTASYADQTYNSLNAFYFVDGNGHSRLVRWSMEPTIQESPVALSSLRALGPDFLEQDLALRLAQAPLHWHLIVTLAEPSDPATDATRAWPTDRRKIDLGTLTVQRAVDEADGTCRDYNFDPTVLPAGIRPSADPLLAARSSSYAKSFDLREAEARSFTHQPRPHEAAP